MARSLATWLTIFAIAQGGCLAADDHGPADRGAADTLGATDAPDAVHSASERPAEYAPDNVYCSAKVDCSHPDADGVERPFLLLRDATGVRARTVIIGFACSGAGDPHLYLDPVIIDCGAAGTSVLATDGEDQVSQGPTPPLVFDHMAVRGTESLGDALVRHYWNVAIGVSEGAFPTDAICTLRLRGAGAPRDLVGEALVPDGTWAAIRWEVALNTPPGDALTCGQNPLVIHGDTVFLDESPQAPFAGSYP